MFELGIHRGTGFAAVAGRPGTELELGACADLADAPGQAVAFDQTPQPRGQALSPRMHGRENFRAQKGAQRGAHGCHRQQVGREGGADARVARGGRALGRFGPFGQFGAETVGCAGHAAADGLAHHHRVGFDAVGARVTARAAAEGVCFVHHQQAAVAPDQCAGLRPVARVGQHHADVRHHRLGQHAGDVAGRQRGLQSSQVVEFDHPGGRGEVLHLPEQAGALHGPALDQVDEHIVDGAVVAAVEDQQHAPAGGGTQPAQHETVGIGGGHCELPLWQAEAIGQQLRHHGGVFAGQHGGQAACRLGLQGRGHRGRRMPEHGSRVAEAEIDQRVAIHVGQFGAVSLRHLQGERRAPVAHPVQGHAEQHVPGGLLGQGPRARPAVRVPLALALEQPLQPMP